MSRLFETTTLKDLELDNRFVRSATWLGMAGPDGACTPRLIKVMTELAQGGLGLILTGYAYVQREGQSAPWQMGCYDDHLLPGLTEMTQSVHKAGGKIMLQIGHGGVFSSSELTGAEPLGPSAMPTEQGPLGRAMAEGEIEDTLAAYASAATRAVQAGFDGIQIHAAHGYLLSQFLSPFFNRRTDAYGGSLENRTRLLMQVVERVREAVGNGYPVLVKLNSEDCLEGGLTNQEMLSVGAMLQTAGIDAIEMSGGTILGLVMNKPEISFSPVGDRQPYWRQAAEQFKSKIDLPLILVGGIRSCEMAKELIESGVADYISLCRPLIREPGLINRWKEGDARKADCISDNACVMGGVQGKGVHCVHVDQGG
jgi:2,4-dienoyl-CoA reductase-like NADH-dependent reductase (Old Yellow Enzyme family)